LLKTLFRLLVVIALLGAVVAYFRWRGPGHAGGDLGALSERVGDAKVAALVKTALAVHRDLRRCEIAVSTEDGVVTLRGEVPDSALRARAEALALAVPNVRQVVNHLRVGARSGSAQTAERTLGESLDDRAVEVRVRLALSLDRSLADVSIGVAVFRRAVTLSGEVAGAGQAEAALRLARETEGVASVIDRLSVRAETSSRVARVRRALAANQQLSLSELSVRERGGRLVLSGRVRTGAERDLAALLAEKAGAGPIDNRLRVSP
jgi:hyperosmotically inducible periplasmic protein